MLHTNKKTNVMKNLLNTLSEALQAKLVDFGVTEITVEFEEVNVRSEYDLDPSFIEAIERELKELGHEIAD